MYLLHVIYYQGEHMNFRIAVFELASVLLFQIAFSFSPNTTCVDVNGNSIPCPESGSSFIFNETYQANITPSNTAPSGNYSSDYFAGNYRVTEEAIENYNQIGGKVGTHWIGYKKERVISYLETPTIRIIKSIHTDWNHGLPKIRVEYKTVNYLSDKIPTGISFSFKRCLRSSISDINVYDPSSSTEGVEKRIILTDNPSLKRILNVHSISSPYTNDQCIASAYVLLGKGDSDPWNKPLIVSDGFDPRARIGIQEILESVPNSLAPSANTFMKAVTDQGFDVIFVDYRDGGYDIVENSKTLLRVIEEVSSRSSGKVVVSGYSMGGLLARIALLLGEKNNLSCMSKISKFLSIDAPNLGGQINLDMQNKLLSIVNKKLDDPLNYLSYETVASVAYDLQSKAARQMLFTHATASEHDAFYGFIKSIGDYPKRIKSYAIADASWKWPYPSTSLSGQFAATFNGTNLFVKDEDLFPGSYIDLWACADGDLNNFFPSFVPSFSINLLKNYLGIETVAPSNPTFGDNHFKPTHIPLYSALGIDKNSFVQISEPKCQSDLDNIALQYSPFSKVFLVDFNSRPRHIVFDEAMEDKVLISLRNTGLSAILNLLLPN